MSFPAKHTTPSEIIFINNKLPIKKTPGHDLLTNCILKNIPKKAILFLTHIYNASLRFSYFSSFWKKSNIIPIIKQNKHLTYYTTYRPISFLLTFSKIPEKIILKQIDSIVIQYKIIHNTQFGFKYKHLTTYQLHRFVDLLHQP